MKALVINKKDLTDNIKIIKKIAKETGIPTSKAGIERKVGKIILSKLFK